MSHNKPLIMGEELGDLGDRLDTMFALIVTLSELRLPALPALLFDPRRKDFFPPELLLPVLPFDPRRLGLVAVGLLLGLLLSRPRFSKASLRRLSMCMSSSIRSPPAS